MKREVSQKIGEEGALPYMIGLLRSPDERIQEQVPFFFLVFIKLFSFFSDFEL